MKKKQTPKKSKNKELGNLRHTDEYLEFISWMAVPSNIREPKTQSQLAKKLGVGPDTLSEWKQRESFFDSVMKKRKLWCRERTPDVIYALYNRAVKTGNAPEVKLWLQMSEDWSERIITKPESKRPFEDLTDEELAEAINDGIKFLRKK
jgi:transcriptional regulator with XRE-family HTH domain